MPCAPNAFCLQIRRNGSTIDGQAMIEFVIAILLVVIIIAGMLQFVELAGRKGELLAEIRAEAGEQAMGRRLPLVVRPLYILNWEVGADEIRHTADDTRETGLAGGTLQQTVINRTVQQEADWQRLDTAHNAAIPILHDSAIPLSALGFIHAELHDEVTLLPAMRDWLIGKPTVTVGTELWFPKLALEGFE